MPQPITIENVYGGISQKNERLRKLNQFQDVVNCDVSLEEGLYKRNGSVFVSALEFDVSSSKAYTHTFLKDEDTQYYMVFDGSGVKVYDGSGVEQQVVFGSSDTSAYFSGIENPREVFNTLTLGDGVVVNRKDVITRMDESLTDGPDASVAYFFVKQAQLGTIPLKWWLTLDGSARYGKVMTATSHTNQEVTRDSDTGWFDSLGISTEVLSIYIAATINNTTTVGASPATAGDTPLLAQQGASGPVRCARRGALIA